jgi:hypothetical protein
VKIPATRHLDDLERRLEVTGGRTRELTSDLREEQLLWRPAPGRWGIADCFEHLLLADAPYFPRVREAIERSAPVAGGERVYAPGLLARWFVKSVSPEGTLKLPAPKKFRPPPDRPDRADAPERFLADQEVLAGLLADARDVDLQGAKITSPVTSLLRLTIGEALTLLVSHQERHLGQAEAVRRDPRFPA